MVSKLKTPTYKSVSVVGCNKNESDNTTLPKQFVEDCQVDTDLELLFPDSYIPNSTERINLYRELDNIENEERLSNFNIQLKDRFGPLPPQTQELLDVVRLRWLAVKLGFEKIVLKNNMMIGYFISDQTSCYFKSKIFENILSFVQKKPVLFKLKEGNNKLNLSIKGIESIYAAYNLLESIYDNQ